MFRQNKLNGDAILSFLIRAQHGRRGTGGERIGDKKAGVKKAMKKWANRSLRYQPIVFDAE